jgi:hypothetical protein
VTVAQLVHPVRRLAWPQHGIPFRMLWRSVSRGRSCNAALWRETATGLGFALVGLVILAAAFDAAGTASPPSDALVATAPAIVRTAQPHQAAIWQNPAEGLIEAMPVP